MEDEIQFFSEKFDKEELIDFNQNIKRTKYEIKRYKMQIKIYLRELKELFNEWQLLKKILLAVKEKSDIKTFYDVMSNINILDREKLLY